MRITAVSLRDFRSYEAADVNLGPALTVLHGPNGAGKTNLLEGIYFGCTGRSFRTANDREAVRFGAAVSRIELEARDADGKHCFSVGFAPGEPKRLRADGVAVERLTDVEPRPLVCVFAPDRLELVKGAPTLRRAHLDALVAAVWPGRAQTRHSYARALAQRNALLGRIRAGAATRDALVAWDSELARHGIALRDDRAAAVALVNAGFADRADALGLYGDVELTYRPRTRAATATDSPPSWRSASRPIWIAASPVTGPTATIWRSGSAGASCASTDRRASSASACWRCCWPSATRSRLPATGHRCCCSTT